MIELSHVSYSYPGASAPAISDLSLRIDEGEFLLVCGPSGAGKSSFLRALNGLVPHFYGGRFSGSVRLWGRDTLQHQPRDLADLVGFVFQDPESQFVVDVVEDEIVFGMENLGLPQTIMRRRAEEVLDQLGIAHLRRQRVSALSGGEKQRVAIAAVLAAQPRALVLDEPTSQLDPHGAEEVLTALQKLNADLGLTIILCEHRLERVVQYADRILFFPGVGSWGLGAGESGPTPNSQPPTPTIGPTREMLGQIGLVPPLQGLGRALGWQPLPLTIKEGRAFVARQPLTDNRQPTAAFNIQHSTFNIRLQGVTLRYGDHEALYRLSLAARPGELLALMGRNGSGKSSLLKALVGLARPSEGRVEVAGRDIARVPTEELARSVGYVPQDPRSILYHDTLREELEFTLRGRGQGTGDRGQVAEDRIQGTLTSLGIAHLAEAYPRALSGGEAQRAALAAILVGDPQILLLDEPTRGLDYSAKADLAGLLRALCAAGRTVIMATHDVELAAACADRVALLGDGELVVEGPAAEVLGDSLYFSPQIAKLFPGSGWLTLEDALGGLSP
ncbi:ATP-binding cassette domain-containing protein [Oscillochloris sp. ZM17-4]|uniref:ABC transporter ATP-binding protein n=1 Tax=Oscillochloris sp. ZM17-4 TaxID=2866714 RepID=UPI001C73CD63|nr:ATP-binding cassette domain-containing protein [Oscillochloris sp. ZM17-4]MBX0330296.1 ATP-binding cassette domain-containing protein [Oscillochloris sp. ZM17-4]